MADGVPQLGHKYDVDNYIDQAGSWYIDTKNMTYEQARNHYNTVAKMQAKYGTSNHSNKLLSNYKARMDETYGSYMQERQLAMMQESQAAMMEAMEKMANKISAVPDAQEPLKSASQNMDNISAAASRRNQLRAGLLSLYNRYGSQGQSTPSFGAALLGGV